MSKLQMVDPKKKYRTVRLLLYAHEDPAHIFAMKKLAENGYSFVAIDHDKDLYSEDDECSPEKIGTLKKKHTHVVIRFGGPRYPKPFCESLGISLNYCFVCDNPKNAMLYLVHYGYEDKHQYDFEECYGPLKFELSKYLECDNEADRVLRVLDILDTLPKPATYRQFLVKACENGLYSEFRRLGAGVSKLLDEHNGLVGFYDC